MKEGSRFCRNCPLHAVCHPKLIPEHLSATTGKISEIPNNFTKYGASFCRHFTCNDPGMLAAREALALGNFTLYTLFDGRIVMAAAFGSIDKPTQNGLRIIDKQGNIYSLQNGKYYSTGAFVSA